MTLCAAFSFRLVAVLLVAFSGPLAAPAAMGPLDGRPLWRAHGREKAAQGLLLTRLLATLNLTEQQGGPQHHLHHLHRDQMGPPRPEAPRETADYMQELYHQFAPDLGGAAPSASTVVRSFRNQDSSPYRVTVGGTRVHPLLFNISVPRREHTRLAQLRLHTTTATPSTATTTSTTVTQRSKSSPRKVTVYEVLGRERPRGGDPEEEEEQEEEEVVLVPLATKRIGAKGSGNWLSLDLTPAVEMWVASGWDMKRRLEVHVHGGPWVKELEVEEEEEDEEGRAAAEITEEEEEEEEEEEDDVVVIQRNATSEHNAVMVVFSDPDPTLGSSRELQDADGSRDPSQSTESADGLQKHLQPLPGGLEEEEEREGHTPQEPSDDPSQEEEEQDRPEIYAAGHGRRQRRSSAKLESCRRRSLYVDFKDIGWDQWVIQPLGYEAYECSGTCSMPMTSEVSPTKHALVQTLLSHRRPQKTARACCVPTKLDAISLLYHDNGVVTFNTKYEGMVVLECGCR